MVDGVRGIPALAGVTGAEEASSGTRFDLMRIGGFFGGA